MPPRTGKCTNFGLCTKADSREMITTVEGQGFRCPECNRTLSLTALSTSTFPARTAAAVAAAMLLAALYLSWPSIAARFRGGPFSTVSEASQLTSFGDMTSPAAEHVLGLDGIAVILSKNNPVESLSKGQVAQLFAGEITDWSQVGGPSGPVNIYARDDKSGTYDTFKTL